ncbi:MAG: NAD(+) diphosphatase [Pseudomonadota bacterium]
MPITNTFDIPQFDRSAIKRRDPDWWPAAADISTTRILPVWRGNVLIGQDSTPRAVALNGADPWWREFADWDRSAFLGFEDGAAWGMAALHGETELEGHPQVQQLGRFADLRSAGMVLPPLDAGLLAYSRALSWFHDQHKFCGRCGKPTKPAEAGHARVCTDENCATIVYPRSDPAVIVLIHDGQDRCVLGRGRHLLPGMHSTLAGFVEAGESLETCVRREIKEEAGLDLAEITYRHSQPWPFPQSLMVGFHAVAASKEIVIDEVEMEHVGWYERDWLKERAAQTEFEEGEFRLPPDISIARQLIDEWLYET